jgi:hypothetical protein
VVLESISEGVGFTSKRPEESHRDLHPNHMAGQNVGEPEPGTGRERTAFHLRKAGLDLGRIDDEELKRVPVLGPGTRLQQGATYVDLKQQPPQEFTARADMEAQPGDAHVPKDRVLYEIWNRLIGEEKPGQE